MLLDLPPAAGVTPTPARGGTHISPVLTETVTITPTRSESKTHLLHDPEQWGWAELRDYVVDQIESRFGVFPRDARKEASIFKRFCAKYGSAAPAIARHAMETCDGWWMNAPVSVTRFCKGSDEWFGDPILARLEQ